MKPYKDVVVCGAAVEAMSRIPNGAAGAVITDPPFFVGTRRDEGGLGYDPWVKDVGTMEGMIKWSEPLAHQIFRILRPGGSVVMMGGYHSITAWEVAAAKAGLITMNEVTVLWNTGKPRSRNFGSLCTIVRWYIKPGAKHSFNSPQKAIYSNVLVAKKVPEGEKWHQAQKPVELTNFFVSLMSEKEDLIVDPFCGSGSTLVSAAMCGRPWFGSDTDKDYCDIARTRATMWEFEPELEDLCLWCNNRLTKVEGYAMFEDDQGFEP